MRVRRCHDDPARVDRWGGMVPPQAADAPYARSSTSAASSSGGWSCSCTAGCRQRVGHSRSVRMAARLPCSKVSPGVQMASALMMPSASDRHSSDRGTTAARRLVRSHHVWRCSSGRATRFPGCATTAFVADCQRAYNDWLADFCAVDPTRLFGVAARRRSSVARACAEVEHAVARGLRAVFVRPSHMSTSFRSNHHVYDDFWSTLPGARRARSLPSGVHVDTPGAVPQVRARSRSARTRTDHHPMAMDEIHGGSALGQAVGHPVDMIVTNGGCDGRCLRAVPALKLCFSRVERRVDAVTARPHGRAGRRPSARAPVALVAPSEYFARQCYVSFEPEEWNLAAAAERLGTDRILWASIPASRVPPGSAGRNLR